MLMDNFFEAVNAYQDEGFVSKRFPPSISEILAVKFIHLPNIFNIG